MSHGKALVSGSTGLVGASLIRQLASRQWEEVRALTRRPFPAAPPITPIIVDFEQDTPQLPLFGVTHVFSCLGTTIKQAGSQQAFRRVDYDIPLLIARAAREAGVPHFLLVSSVGASAKARTFYLRVKGELEEAIAALGFRSVTIVRPSFLEGDRQEKRLGETIGVPIFRLFPRAYRSVHVDQVASAMIAAAEAGRPGVDILENPRLLDYPRPLA
jgi:uncharacterized protein YbjT (DUF2867 family)